eukprot:1142322-Pelagomonas_calceolata.AAC.2
MSASFFPSLACFPERQPSENCKLKIFSKAGLTVGKDLETTRRSGSYHHDQGAGLRNSAALPLSFKWLPRGGMVALPGPIPLVRTRNTQQMSTAGPSQ